MVIRGLMKADQCMRAVEQGAIDGGPAMTVQDRKQRPTDGTALYKHRVSAQVSVSAVRHRVKNSTAQTLSETPRQPLQGRAALF